MQPEPRNILDILGIKVTINDTKERLPKSELLIGEMLIGDDFISDNYILDNTLYKEDMNLLFFVKYHRLNNYSYFTINFYDFGSKTLYQFDKEFGMLYLKEFVSDNKLPYI